MTNISVSVLITNNPEIELRLDQSAILENVYICNGFPIKV